MRGHEQHGMSAVRQVFCIGHRNGPDVQLSWFPPAEAAHCTWVKQMPLACDDANNCPYHPTLSWGVMTNIVESR